MSTPRTDKLAALKRPLLPESIANLVAEAIAEQRMVADERIVETALAAELNVSRVPVREALKILHTQGIISGGGHKGFRVASFSPKTVQSVQEARIDLETLILRDAIANLADGSATMDRIDAVLEGMKTAARAGDFPGMLRADLDFHRALCEAADNPIFTTLWNAIARHVMIILNLARFQDVDLATVLRRHKALRDAIAKRIDTTVSPADLRSLLEHHFQFERMPRLPLAPAAAPAAPPPSVKRPASRRQRAGTTPL